MNGLLYAALGFVLLAAASAYLRPDRERFLSMAGAGMLLAALLFLASRYLLLDLDYQVVFLYTREGLPWYYRLSGTWTSREGSLLLWSFYIAVVAALYRGGRTTRMVMYAILAAFIVMVIRHDLFAATPAYYLAGRPQGNGLNPSLQSPFMLIHPPLMFLAYALTTLPAAKSIQHWLRGDQQWSTDGQWMRFNWMLYTFTMGLGGIWAYYTLGFGGYWAWDPVEVANMLPWLALVLYLHARLHHQRHGDHALIGPLLGVLPFLLTIFSTLSTRSGLWVSVHAFTDPTDTFNPDAGARFLDILALEPGVRFHLGLMMAVTFVSLALYARRTATDLERGAWISRLAAFGFGALAVHAALAPVQLWGLLLEVNQMPGGLLAAFGIAVGIASVPAFQQSGESFSWRNWNRRVFVHFAILTLGLGLMVLTLYHFQSVNGWSQAFYENRIPWLAMPALIGMSAFQLREWLPRRWLPIALWPLSLMAWPTLALIAGAIFAALVAAVRVLAVAKPAQRLPGGLILLAGLGNLLWWVSPPAIGPFTPQWPMQLLLLPSMWVMYQGLRVLQGHQPHPWVKWSAVLFGGGLGLLVLIPQTYAANPRRVLRELGTHAVHFAVAFAILGYAITTLQSSEQFTLQEDQQIQLAGVSYTWSETPVESEPGTPWGAAWHPTLTGNRDVSGTLYYEVQTGSHYPLPGTLRTLTGDVYLKIDALCRDADCQDRMQAYESGPRVVGDTDWQAVQGELRWIPGIGLVWGGLALLIGSVAVLLQGKRENHSPQGSVRVGS